MKKALRNASMILLSMLLLVTNVGAKSKNVNLRIYPVSKEILSGTTANFIMEVKATGSKASLEDLDLEVDIPEGYELSSSVEDMRVFGTSPKIIDNKMHYHFDKLETGKTQRAVIKIKSTNGMHSDKEEIVLKGSIFDSEGILIASDKCKTLVRGSGNIEVAKKLKEVVGRDKTDAPKAGDTLVWVLRTSSKKANVGQVYIDENSKIILRDTLPKDLVYISDNAGGVYDEDSHTVTWKFDAPTLKQQEAASDILFVHDVEVKTRVADVDETTYHIESVNRAKAEMTLIGGDAVNAHTESTVVIADGDGWTPSIDGTYYHGNHYGPQDGLGGQSSWQNANPTPSVYDNALLNFGIQYYIHPGSGSIVNINGSHYGYDDLGYYNYASIVREGYDWITFTYEVDNKLLLDKLSLGQAYDNYITTSEVKRLANLPKGLLEFHMGDGSVITHQYEYSEFEGSSMNLELSKILGDNRDVSKVVLKLLPNDNYKVIDGRIGIPGLMNLDFKVKKGSVGSVSNDYKVSYFAHSLGQVDIDYYADWANNGPRNAIIVPVPEGTPPIGATSISLENDYSGIIMPGENTLSVELENIRGSLEDISGPFELYVKLPNNITINEDVQCVSNYTITNIEKIHSNGDVIYKITANGADLTPGDKINVNIPVDIKDEGKTNLDMSVYARHEGKDILAPDYAGDALTNTVTVKSDDELIIHGLLDPNSSYLKSNNSYTLLKSEELVVTKEVKGALDDDWSNFGHTIIGGYVDYKIEMWHTIDAKIDNMVLVDVLPNVGDLGITDNVERDSAFRVELDGPLSLNEELRDLFDVYYSTASNPKRDDLSENTSRPLENPEGAQDPNWMKESDVEDWSEINSFMIKLKQSMEWPEKTKLTVSYRMYASEDIDNELISIGKDDPHKTDKAAWNSTAVAIEDMQVIEPSRVGVAIVDDIEVEEPPITGEGGENPVIPEGPNTSIPEEPEVEIPITPEEPEVEEPEVPEIPEVPEETPEEPETPEENEGDKPTEPEEPTTPEEPETPEVPEAPEVEKPTTPEEPEGSEVEEPETPETPETPEVDGPVIPETPEVDEPTVPTPETPEVEVPSVEESDIHENERTDDENDLESNVSISEKTNESKPGKPVQTSDQQSTLRVSMLFLGLAALYILSKREK